MDNQFMIQLQKGDINIKLILTLMFSFKDQMPLLPKGGQKLNPIPDVEQPDKLFSLPSLPFYIEASEPLSQSDINHIKNNKRNLQDQIQKIMNERNSLQLQYNRLNEEYLRMVRQHQSLKQRYKQGEFMYREMQSQNMRLYHELQALKNKKQEKSRVNILKKKQVPIVKISVPNPKTLGQQSEKDSIYRQLKTASEELVHMRKILESQKQKAQHTQSYLSKNIQQLSFERDSLKNQILALRDQNKMLKQDAGRLKSPKNIQNNSMRIKSMLENSEYEKLKFDYDRLERVHKSCDILLQSKQNQILSLKDDIHKLNQSIKNRNNENQRTFMRTQSKHNLDNSYIYAKDTGYKQNLGNTFMPESSAKKMFDINYEQENNSILQQHLELSAKEMKNIQQFTKSLVKDFVSKIDQLKNEVEWANKKAEHQKFELQRVYQLLRDKKLQLENCYKDMRAGGKNNRGTPMKEIEKEDQYLKSILKGRRDLSA